MIVIGEFVNGPKNTGYHSQFSVPGSAVAPASADEFASAAAPASAAPPNLQLCPAEEVTIIPHMLLMDPV
ncbi:hypothetical protein L195_g054282 [Trifolium pratense]|uniref:Uncharacterized protein n=1 Tax=Trifolium pratense TaxID=57577 RepID=A0A2K3JP93_TRIPR|nr:hypothetical protein L195_g049498 [Trifolium pratense]PNX64941.1 hypothetical protein L195_g054282 [Trifolium pratense]